MDPKSGHGFAGSKPVVMWDTKTLKTIRTIDVQGGPDAILFDEFNQRVYIFSHTAPHATVIDAVDGAVLGTIDLGGMPEQAVTDGTGHVYVDIRDKQCHRPGRNEQVCDTFQPTSGFAVGAVFWERNPTLQIKDLRKCHRPGQRSGHRCEDAHCIRPLRSWRQRRQMLRPRD